MCAMCPFGARTRVHRTSIGRRGEEEKHYKNRSMRINGAGMGKKVIHFRKAGAFFILFFSFFCLRFESCGGGCVGLFDSPRERGFLVCFGAEKATRFIIRPRHGQCSGHVVPAGAAVWRGVRGGHGEVIRRAPWLAAARRSPRNNNLLFSQKNHINIHSSFPSCPL